MLDVVPGGTVQRQGIVPALRHVLVEDGVDAQLARGEAMQVAMSPRLFVGGSLGRGAGGGAVGPQYRSGPPAAREADIRTMTAPLPAAEVRRRQILAKLHPDIAAVVTKLRSGAAVAAAAQGAAFVRQGKADIQVFLEDDSAAALGKLKNLGFEVVLQPKSGKLVIGRAPVEALAALAELDVVRYVAPHSSK